MLTWTVSTAKSSSRGRAGVGLLSAADEPARPDPYAPSSWAAIVLHTAIPPSSGERNAASPLPIRPDRRGDRLQRRRLRGASGPSPARSPLQAYMDEFRRRSDIRGARHRAVVASVAAAMAAKRSTYGRLIEEQRAPSGARRPAEETTQPLPQEIDPARALGQSG